MCIRSIAETEPPLYTSSSTGLSICLLVAQSVWANNQNPSSFPFILTRKTNTAKIHGQQCKQNTKGKMNNALLNVKLQGDIHNIPASFPHCNKIKCRWNQSPAVIRMQRKSFHLNSLICSSQPFMQKHFMSCTYSSGHSQHFSQMKNRQ